MNRKSVWHLLRRTMVEEIPPFADWVMVKSGYEGNEFPVVLP